MVRFGPLLLLLLSLTEVLISICSFDHHLVQTIINKIVERGDKCHSAIIHTLTCAQHGYTFADNVAAFYDTLAERHDCPRHPSELLFSLVEIAGKAHRRSVKARDQLIDVRDELLKVNSTPMSRDTYVFSTRYQKT